jgi:hypothetical protein
MQEYAENAGVVPMRRCGTSPFPAMSCFGVAVGNGRPQPFPSADLIGTCRNRAGV